MISAVDDMLGGRLLPDLYFIQPLQSGVHRLLARTP
jgi:hypothetical protein